MRIDSGLLTFMAEELAEYADDMETFWDTLDGETDIMDAVGHVIRQIVEADAAIVATDEMVKRYTARKSGHQARRQALQRTLKMVMQSTGQKKIPHPLGTVSLREGVNSVHIPDPDAIPSQLCKITRLPDKTAIKKLLLEGEEIEGAELVKGPESVSLRMK